jgi:hypothetical protein
MMPTPIYINRVMKPVGFYCSEELLSALKFIYMFFCILMFLCVSKVTVDLNMERSLPEYFQVIA